MLMYMSGLRDADARHLEALVAVADLGTFGRAASQLGFSQSAVSQQIAALERLVGVVLFDRPKGPRPPELTPAGALLLEHARAVLARLDAASEELERLRLGDHGRLVIGAFQSVSAKVLPAVVGRLRHDRPDLEIRLFEADDNAALGDGVVDGSLDLAFLVDDEDDPRLDKTFLTHDPYVLLVPAGSEPSGRRVAIETLDGAAMIGQPEANVCQMLIDRALRVNHVQPTWVFRSVDNGAVQAMVRSGMGQALVSYLACDPDDPQVDVVEVEPPIPPRRIVLARRPGRTLHPAADEFERHAREVCAERLADRPAELRSA
jgi:DNA-binding transcriptional LysR family regulator